MLFEKIINKETITFMNLIGRTRLFNSIKYSKLKRHHLIYEKRTSKISERFSKIKTIRKKIS